MCDFSDHWAPQSNPMAGSPVKPSVNSPWLSGPLLSDSTSARVHQANLEPGLPSAPPSSSCPVSAVLREGMCS